MHIIAEIYILCMLLQQLFQSLYLSLTIHCIFYKVALSSCV